MIESFIERVLKIKHKWTRNHYGVTTVIDKDTVMFSCLFCDGILIERMLK